MISVKLLNGDLISVNPDDLPKSSEKEKLSVLHHVVAKEMGIFEELLTLTSTSTSTSSTTFVALVDPHPLITLCDRDGFNVESIPDADMAAIRHPVVLEWLLSYARSSPNGSNLLAKLARNPHPCVISFFVSGIQSCAQTDTSIFTALFANPSNDIVQALHSDVIFRMWTSGTEDLKLRILSELVNNSNVDGIFPVLLRIRDECPSLLPSHTQTIEQGVGVNFVTIFTSILALPNSACTSWARLAVHPHEGLLHLLRELFATAPGGLNCLKPHLQRNSHPLAQEMCQGLDLIQAVKSNPIFVMLQKCTGLGMESYLEGIEMSLPMMELSRVSAESNLDSEIEKYIFTISDDLTGIGSSSSQSEDCKSLSERLELMMNRHVKTPGFAKFCANPHPRAVDWILAHLEQLWDHENAVTIFHNPNDVLIDVLWEYGRQSNRVFKHIPFLGNPNPRAVVKSIEWLRDVSIESIDSICFGTHLFNGCQKSERLAQFVLTHADLAKRLSFTASLQIVGGFSDLNVKIL